MKKIIDKRRSVFNRRCLRYLRYVLNDHFVVFLLVFMGFLAVGYRHILSNLPAHRLPFLVILLVGCLFFLPVGSFASYIEKPDQLFLLPKEQEVIDALNRGNRRSLLLWGVVQSGCLLLLFPLFLALGLSPFAFGCYLFFLLLGKYLVFENRKKRFLLARQWLNWAWLIKYEQQRKQRLLRFFSLFTQVKGISNSVKRRAYLDRILALIPMHQENIWKALYLRSYLRNGDYFSLSLRLLFLSLVMIGLVDLPWLSGFLVLLCNYLLLFQLLGLYTAFDYQCLTHLFPLGKKEKLLGLKAVIKGIVYSFLVVESLFWLLFSNDKRLVGLLVLGTVCLNEGYLVLKLKKLVDES